MPPRAHDAWLAWYASTPDAPCIAICSTSQGDAVCKGCGRTFLEVQRWTEMTPAEKRATWRRITQEGTAWRFNRYAERAGDGAARAPTTAPKTRRRRRRGMTRLGLRHGARRIAPLRLAGVRRPGRRARVQHRRHGDGRAHLGDSTSPRSRSASRSTSRSSSASWASSSRSARSPASCTAPASCARAADEAQQAMWLGARPGDPGLRAAALSRAVPRPRPRRAGGRGQGARLPARPRLRAAAGARLHRLPRLQRRHLAAEGGDGDADRRPRPQGAGERRCFVFGLDLRDAVRRAARAGARRRRLRHRDRHRHVVPARRRAAGGCATIRSIARFGFGRGMTIARPSAASLARAASPRRADGAGDRWSRSPASPSWRSSSRASAPTAVAGHQIAVNMVSMMFMLPLAIANAASTLVAQRVGAGDAADARRIGWAGLEIGVARRGRCSAARCTCCASRWSASTPPIRSSSPRRAAARLGRAVPHRRRGADDRRVRAARLSHRDRAAARLRVRASGASASAAATSSSSISAGVSPPWMHGARGFWSMATLGLATAGARHDAARVQAAPRPPARLARRPRDRRGEPIGAELGGRNDEHEAAAAALARLAAHAAAVALGDLLDERQAEADAAGLLGVAGQAEERLEDALAHRRRERRDRDRRPAPRRGRRAAPHRARARPRSRRRRSAARSRAGCAGRGAAAARRRSRTRRLRASTLRADARRLPRPRRRADRPARGGAGVSAASRRLASSTSSTRPSSSATLLSISRFSSVALRRARALEHRHRHLHARERRAQLVAGVGEQRAMRLRRAPRRAPRRR